MYLFVSVDGVRAFETTQSTVQVDRLLQKLYATDFAIRGWADVSFVGVCSKFVIGPSQWTKKKLGYLVKYEKKSYDFLVESGVEFFVGFDLNKEEANNFFTQYSDVLRNILTTSL